MASQEVSLEQQALLAKKVQTVQNHATFSVCSTKTVLPYTSST